jgi:hypothetical protein
MLYVERATDGKIIALHSTPNPTALEQKSLTDEEVLEFFNSTDSRQQLMAYSDIGAIRIVEDLIDLLVRKNIINLTELPEQAQQRIRERKRLRKNIASQELLVDDVL